MKAELILILSLVFALHLSTESKSERKSLLNSEPGVIYLEEILEVPIGAPPKVDPLLMRVGVGFSVC